MRYFFIIIQSEAQKAIPQQKRLETASYKNDSQKDKQFADEEIKKLNDQTGGKKNSRINYELDDEDIEQL